MKTIYVNESDFICNMEPAEGRMEIRTGVFDGMSDQEIEGYRFVPEGYRWVDPDSGESFTGQHVMPVYHGLGGTLRNILNRLNQHDLNEYDRNEAFDDIYAALAELGSLIG